MVGEKRGCVQCAKLLRGVRRGVTRPVGASEWRRGAKRNALGPQRRLGWGAGLGCWAGVLRHCGQRNLIKQAAVPPASSSWQGRGWPACTARGSSGRRTGWKCPARTATPAPRPSRRWSAPRPGSVVFNHSQSGGWRRGDKSGRSAGPRGQAALLRATRPWRRLRAALWAAVERLSDPRQCGRALGLLAVQRGLLDLGGGTALLGARRGNCEASTGHSQPSRNVCV